MLRKLRIKFVIINMCVVSLLLLVIFGLLCGSTYAKLRQQSMELMQELGQDPFQISAPGQDDRGMSLPYFVLQLGRSGELIGMGGGFFDLSDKELLSDIVAQALASGRASGEIKDYSLRYCRFISPLSQRLVFVDISSHEATMKSLLESCALLGLVSFAAFLGISMALARWAVKPVDRAWQQQRQFVADASHELKTPLTVILANAQMLQQPDFDSAQKEQMVSSIAASSRQMKSLVEDMLDLARADSGQSREERKLLDFSRLVEDRCLIFEPLMFENGLMLESQIEPGISIKGCEAQLQQLTDILLDNASKYSLPGGTVRLSLQAQNRHALLKLSNPSSPLSRDMCRDIFKRFYRSDKARSASGSYGLGLPIAEALVKAHGGKISCQYIEGEAVFTVDLPI